MIPTEITNGSIKTQKYWSSTQFQNNIYGRLMFIHATEEGLTNWLVFVIFQSSILVAQFFFKGPEKSSSLKAAEHNPEPSPCSI